MSNPHVLVVDDEADIRALIQDILSDEGYGVTVAADAGEARTARTKCKFDLILLDIWMPDTDGITLLREWSDNGDLNCPVVIMSGHGTVDTAVEVLIGHSRPDIAGLFGVGLFGPQPIGRRGVPVRPRDP